MGIVIRFNGTRAELLNLIHQVPAVASGRVPDPTGSFDQLKLGMGLALLGKIQGDYERMSEGQTGDMGIRWDPLSLVTIALRRHLTTPAAQRQLKQEVRKLSPERQAKVKGLYRQFIRFYRGRHDRKARKDVRHALTILQRRLRGVEAQRSKIGTVQTEKRKRPIQAKIKELAKIKGGKLTAQMARRLAFAAAHVLILRDTGRMFNSLGPGIVSSDQVAEYPPGKVIVGTNVDYAKYHQSKLPRKLKKDGTPKLPRRQFLPDDTHPIPVTWWPAIVKPLSDGLSGVAFWGQYLSQKVGP